MQAVERPPPAERPPALNLVLSDAPVASTWSREELYDDDGR
ncbi:MAG: hypothetical protein V4850_06150 [Myxococcota bacterium]